MNAPARVIVTGPFDDLRARDVRFLQEAASFGPLTALVWPDAVVEARDGHAPKFPLAERLYFLRALRYVDQARAWEAADDAGPTSGGSHDGTVLVLREAQRDDALVAACLACGFGCHVLPEASLDGFPAPPPRPVDAGLKKVIVSGSFDWFHTGHVRFLEEASRYGSLFAVVGHDENIRRLKGDGHPLLGEDERRYMVGSIRFVTQALISTGHGWLDAEPDIQAIAPDIYVVNDDGDKGGKRAFCEARGIAYVVLARTPAPGLPPRSSTALRGF